jgi:DNA mismatch endonuclease, patch repair protein
MASISGKETKPEIQVRLQLFKRGFRYRKNVKTLPGKPDIVLPKYKTIILIHGCFWHGHHCKRGTKPTSNIVFWTSKIKGNIDRDKRVKMQLKKLGWRVLTVWDCQLKNKNAFEKTINNIQKKLLSK